jgi:pyruvate dehydrogenase E2 component (dihydrolipoamide acetyltransferase)
MKLSRIVIAGLAAASFLFAQEAAAPAAKAGKKEAVKTIMGKVVSVDAVANTIIVKVKKGEDTLSVEAGAKITSGKKEIALADIKADAAVTVKCKMVDGKKVAVSISEKAAAAEKVEKKKTETTTTTTTTTEPAAAAPAAEPAAAPAAAPEAAPAAAPAK